MKNAHSNLRHSLSSAAAAAAAVVRLPPAAALLLAVVALLAEIVDLLVFGSWYGP